MDVGILVSREADIPDLARSLPVDERTIGAFLVEDSMWIVIPQDLMMLYKIDAIGPSSPSAVRPTGFSGTLKIDSSGRA